MPTRPWPSSLPTVIELEKAHAEPLPAIAGGDEVRFTEGLVAIFVERLTEPGDVVLDPFAGFGTTPITAERLGRCGYGVELDPERVGYMRSRTAAPERIIHGDARNLGSLNIPPVALSLTSPPYTRPGDEQDALSAYREPTAGYRSYLEGLGEVYGQMTGLLTPDGWAVIEVANLRDERGPSPLAWDVARAVGDVLPFCGEVVVRWQPTYGYGYDHSYCLLFSALA